MASDPPPGARWKPPDPRPSRTPRAMPNPPRFASPVCKTIYQKARESPMSFGQICKLAGVNRHTITYLRQGRAPTLSTLEPICQVLNLRLVVEEIND